MSEFNWSTFLGGLGAAFGDDTPTTPTTPTGGLSNTLLLGGLALVGVVVFIMFAKK